MGRRTQGGPTLNGMNSAKRRKPPGARALRGTSRAGVPNALCKEPDSKRFRFCGPSLSQRLGPVTAASEPCMGLAALQQNLVDKNCQGAMWSPATPWSRVSFSEDMVGNAAGWSWGCQENMRRQGGGLRPASQARSQGADISLTQRAQEAMRAPRRRRHRNPGTESGPP